MINDISRRGFFGAAGVAATAGAVQGTASADGAEARPTRKTIKIIGVACSAREGKNTAQALEACLEAAKAVDPEAIEVELIELAGKRINGLVAAGVELEPGARDDFPEIAPKLSDPAVGGIIIGTPVYFSSMSSLCKEFLERCGQFRKQDYALKNKVAGALAVGGTQRGGQEITVRSVEAVLFAHDMIIVGAGKPNSRFGAMLCSGNGGVAADEFGLGVARSLGQRVAEVARLLGAAADV